ncbi:hypothetical protein CQ018_06685 [Arthrobacter sp. MYb227]|nr:hypothetical protein CQ018_06685 [Arthrobacter sp. MYb227]
MPKISDEATVGTLIDSLVPSSVGKIFSILIDLWFYDFHRINPDRDELLATPVHKQNFTM